MSMLRALGRLGIVLFGIIIAGVLGIGAFWAVPEHTPLTVGSVVLVLLVVLLGLSLAARLSHRLLPEYDVAEVEIDDIITRDGEAGPFPFGGIGLSANEIVEQIERADADKHARALIVKLNTPGGEVVPSEDIRRAAADFEGPTVAYAEDMAASGGYWIASGADEIHARRSALVGSIGVNGVHLGREELRDKIGLSYRRFVAGEYKDTPSPWRELADEEVEYVQGLLDRFYDEFVDTVVDGTELDREFVRDTEARVYLGEEAEELGLVDYSGPRDEMEERLEERLGVDEITVKEFGPERGIKAKIGRGTQAVAHAFGTGIARYFATDEQPRIRV